MSGIETIEYPVLCEELKSRVAASGLMERSVTDWWLSGTERNGYIGDGSCSTGFVRLQTEIALSRRIRIRGRCPCSSEIG